MWLEETFGINNDVPAAALQKKLLQSVLLLHLQMFLHRTDIMILLHTEQ